MLPSCRISRGGSLAEGFWMRRRLAMFATVFVLAFLVTAAVFAPAKTVAAAREADDPLTQLHFILEHLEDNFYRPVDRAAIIQGAIQGALDSLDDPFTRYLDAEELAAMEESIEGAFFGVGIVISQEKGQTVVMSPIADSPAEAAGLQPGDIVQAVDGQDVTGLPLETVGNMIRGPEKTTVTLTILREGEAPRNVELTRRRIRLENIEAKLLPGDIGYIRIVEFRNRTGRETAAAYEDLLQQGAQAFILDLRNNPGGLLSEAIATAEVFVPEGPITHVATGRRDEVTFTARQAGAGLPTAVLINGGSASAAEIVAAAIAENKVGFLVGSKSYGKASVQTIVNLDAGGAVQFTTGQYLTPLRHAIAGQGLTPDIEVPAAGPRQRPEMAPLTGQWVLEKGDRGLEVKGLQQRLAWLGYNVGEADGQFGDLTAAGVRAFQADRGLAADGRLDAATYTALTEAVAEQSRAVVPKADLDDPVVARAARALAEGYRRP